LGVVEGTLTLFFTVFAISSANLSLLLQFQNRFCVFLRKNEDMAAHNELGKEGEDEAVRYLEAKGYRICHRNWRSGRKELDIVAEHKGELVVVEVKTRRNQIYGTPEESISETKIRRIVSSADAYVRKFRIDLPIRFDIISLTGIAKPLQIEHIVNAFHAPIW
jgi:putative endonuclease